MKNKLTVLAALLLAAALLVYSALVLDTARDALSLCAQMIVPTLFPFFAASNLLNRLGLPAYLGRLLSKSASRLFGVSGAGASAFIMGLCGGYPLGAAYIADMVKSGAVTHEEAERLLAFCNNSGPAFIVGAVGVGVFSSSAVGLRLYAVHIVSAVLCGVLLRERHVEKKSESIKIETLPLSLALPDAVRAAVGSVLTVCGFVTAFTVFVSLLNANGRVDALASFLAGHTAPDAGFYRALLTGVFELGSGAAAMRGLPPSPINLALAAFLVGFGGISVFFQTKSVLYDANIKGSLHFAGRLITASISAVLAYVWALVRI